MRPFESGTTGDVPLFGVIESIPVPPPASPIVIDPEDGVIITPEPATKVPFLTWGEAVDPIHN